MLDPDMNASDRLYTDPVIEYARKRGNVDEVEMKQVTEEEFKRFLDHLKQYVCDRTRCVPPQEWYTSADRKVVAKKFYHVGNPIEYWIDKTAEV